MGSISPMIRRGESRLKGKYREVTRRPADSQTGVAALCGRHGLSCLYVCVSLVEGRDAKMGDGGTLHPPTHTHTRAICGCVVLLQVKTECIQNLAVSLVFLPIPIFPSYIPALARSLRAA